MLVEVEDGGRTEVELDEELAEFVRRLQGEDKTPAEAVMRAIELGLREWRDQ